MRTVDSSEDSNDLANQQRTREGLRELALFAGAGGGILGGHLLGWRTVCAVERDVYCAAVLAQRQDDGILAPFPIWSDVETFDGRPWRGLVDVVSGGFPCTNISCAGKGEGIDGPESGLWREMARIVGEVRPKFVFVENSPMLIRRGLTGVLSGIAEMGYDARWCCVSAADVGAPHIRDRIWILGYTDEYGESAFPINVEMAVLQGVVPDSTKQHRTKQGQEAHVAGRICEDVSDTDGLQEREQRWRVRESRTVSSIFAGDGSTKSLADADRERRERKPWGQKRRWESENKFGKRSIPWWPTEPDVGRVAHGVANRVDRIRALGNGQVPRVASAAWRILNER